MILRTIFYYVMYSSVFLLYGVGLSRLVLIRESFSTLLLTCIKTLLTTSASAALAYLIIRKLLVPMGLSELYPFAVVLIYLLISIFIEVFFSIGIGESMTELAIPLLILMLVLNESISLVQTVLAASICNTAFYVLVAIISTLRMRFDSFAPKRGLSVYTFLLISLAAVIIALCAWNVSWLTLLHQA